MTQNDLWEDEKSNALLGNLLPQPELSTPPAPPDPPVDQIPVTPPTEETTK